MRLQPSDPDIQTIVARIRSGDLDLQPEFQRGEVWSVAKKRRLIDSILRKWHVPPIHVVIEKDGRQVVLDGQQRLVSIRDFVNGEFKVDGSIEPTDSSIQPLDGCRYQTLPPEIRREFDQFTIRVYRLTDYSPGEPGELFFRLNQMTYLTAAEQRNAFFGPAREQVKHLVYQLQFQGAEEAIGFSNRRMAYDDVLAKVLCTFEVGTLAKKLTAADISNRFRHTDPFDTDDFDLASTSIELLKTLLQETRCRPRFNKATLFTWLIFLSYFIRGGVASNIKLKNYLIHFNQYRESIQSSETPVLQVSFPSFNELYFMSIYLDRSSSRVSDVSSVILRDFVVWVLFRQFAGDDIPKRLLSSEKYRLLLRSREISKREEFDPLEPAIERDLDFGVWGSLK